MFGIGKNGKAGRQNSGSGRPWSASLQDGCALTMNRYLKLISGDKPLVLAPNDGEQTLAQATDIFRYIDRNFVHWNCDTGGRATNETPVQVYEMAKDATFQEMFRGFGLAVSRLALSQAQIKQFLKRYPDWLKKGGFGTFFLFKAADQFFVAAVYLFSDGRFGVRVRRFALERVFRAEKRHRVVIRISRRLTGER